MRHGSVRVRLTVLALGLALGIVVLLRVAHKAPATWTVGLPTFPHAAVVDARSGRAFIAADSVAGGSNGLLFTLDTATGRILHAVTLDYDPRGVALDAARGRVVVVNEATLDSSGAPMGPGSVSILDARGGRIQRTVLLDASLSAVAIDARSGRALIVEGNDPYHQGILVSLDPVTGREVWQGIPIIYFVPETWYTIDKLSLPSANRFGGGSILEFQIFNKPQGVDVFLKICPGGSIPRRELFDLARKYQESDGLFATLNPLSQQWVRIYEI